MRQPLKTYGEPEWKHDDKEYKELDKSDSYANYFLRMVNRKAISNDEWLFNLDKLKAELWNLFHWFSPYLKVQQTKAKSQKSKKDMEYRRLVIESLLDEANHLFSDGVKRMKYQSKLPSALIKCKILLEMAFSRIKEVKVILGMGVRTYGYTNIDDLEKFNLDNSARY